MSAEYNLRVMSVKPENLKSGVSKDGKAYTTFEFFGVDRAGLPLNVTVFDNEKHQTATWLAGVLEAGHNVLVAVNKVTVFYEKDGNKVYHSPKVTASYVEILGKSVRPTPQGESAVATVASNGVVDWDSLG